MQTNTSRLGKIGASEISGLVKEYAPTLLSRNLITKEQHDCLVMMPNYLDTKYSIAKKHSFSEVELEKFSNFIQNDAMTRGKACEAMVLEQFLNENEGFKVIDSQVRKEITIEDCNIPLIATIDYILEKDGVKYLLECKTTDISIFYRVEESGIPFNYFLQTQQQMYIHGIDKCFVMIAGVKTTSEGKGKPKKYEILSTEQDLFNLDPTLVENGIIQSVSWFDWELKNNKDVILNKDQSIKSKADIEVDNFIADLAGTLEISADEELTGKIMRYFQLKDFIKEAKEIEGEIDDFIREKIGDIKKLNLSAESLKIEAKLTNQSFMTEDDILKNIEKKREDLEKAKTIEIGTPKSARKLIWDFIN